jgi:hypothetical protein
MTTGGFPTMAYEDDDIDNDIDDDDLDDPLAGARLIAGDVEARRYGHVRPVYVQEPASPPITEPEWFNGTMELLDLMEQGLASDDVETVRQAEATMQRFEAIKRQMGRNRPGRIA